MRAFVVGLVVAAAVFAVVALATSGDDDAQPRRAATTTTGAGATLFASMGCGSCHRLAAAGSDAEFGPSLDERLPGHTPASLRAAIVSPPAGTMMPGDFGTRMSSAELDTLVTYLLAARR